MKKNTVIEKLKPLADRVLVRPEPQKEEVDGIQLAPGAQEKPQRGVVLAAGPGVYDSGKLIRLDVKAGHKVLYGKNLGTEIHINGEKLLILRQDDILGTI